MKRQKREIETEENIFYARYGHCAGKDMLFTHRDPKSGELWCDDIGEWVDPGTVKWLDPSQ